ncbi:hypothetical protein [Tepidimonas charontis]|uniref:Uncharacterized protein n=1 Tax=Tepidimonas charontis TaxID=2267262 RepID=A0A554XGE8_9BURK|nr:hypothetical protein [Tepidimonas charontis]TSE34917.1 hypothetical protein Tchar_01108 [Tepidimonas charontis]
MNEFVERRQHLGIRAIFERAYTLAAPFLDPQQGIGGQALVHHVPLVLREHFPYLSREEILVLVPALQTAWRLRNRRTAIVD